jgi:hypothetical protein
VQPVEQDRRGLGYVRFGDCSGGLDAHARRVVLERTQQLLAHVGSGVVAEHAHHLYPARLAGVAQLVLQVCNAPGPLEAEAQQR